MRVATLNLWGRRGAWEERREVLAAGFRELAPDLVAFQEAITTEEHDQVLELLGPQFHVAHQREREPGDGGDVERGQGISIASRWPLARVRELDLHVTPRTAGFACGALAAEIRVPQPLLLVNYLPSWQLDYERERELQALATARFIDELVGDRDLHVLLVGDLDADPEAGSIRFWTGRKALFGTSVCYRDAWESRHQGERGETLSPENPLMGDRDWPFGRIDYILVRCGEHGGPTLEIARCERIFDTAVDGVWASDHFGLVADLGPARAA